MKTFRKFTVEAAASTGEWLGLPEDTGEIVNQNDWHKMSDTDTSHFDTFENFALSESGETCAIEITWVV